MENKLILLVEDNPDDETLTLRTLGKQKLPCEVAVARDGVEALDYLFCTGSYVSRERILPHLVLLDLKLPKVDGLEVLRKLREEPRTRTLPVVVFTSSNESHDINDSYRFGANSYIRKPVDYNQFSEAVRLIGQYWLVENLAPPPVSLHDNH
ncbi:MAG TPA: response regulator [Geobacteraceae bacterium]